MPRKKSVKQKVSQKVVQTVKVIVGDTGKKRRRAGGRRKPRQEPEVETISSKTLAPVYIQPPVAPPSYPFDMSVMPSVAASIAAQRRAAESSAVKLPEDMAGVYEDLRPAAQPLFPTAFEQLAEKQLDVPVAKEKKEKKEKKKNFVISDKPPRGIVSGENPTTAVDSDIPVEESYGVFFDQPTKDTVLGPQKDEFGVTLEDVDKTSPAFVLDPSRDIAAINSELEEKLKKAREEELQKMPSDKEIVKMAKKVIRQEKEKKKSEKKASKELARDLDLYAKLDEHRGKGIEESQKFIDRVRKEKGLSAHEFRAQYIQQSKVVKEKRDITKFQAEKYVAGESVPQPKVTIQTTGNTLGGSPLYDIVQSTTK